MKSLREHLLKESILDPAKDKLDPQIWSGERLKANVRKEIVDKINKWLANFTDKKIGRILYIGSTTGYQYNDDSDIDVNFSIDGIDDAKRKELAKILPSGYPLTGTKHPVNYFIDYGENITDDRGPVYDILNDKWLVKPTKETGTDKNYKATAEISRFFVAGVNVAIEEYEEDVRTYETYTAILKGTKKDEDKKDLETFVRFKLQEIINDLDGIYIAYHMLISLRDEGFGRFENPRGDLQIYTDIKVNNKNTSISNLVYKYAEKLGILTKMHNIMEEGKKWKDLLGKK
jgi:hypothetical protein